MKKHLLLSALLITAVTLMAQEKKTSPKVDFSFGGFINLNAIVDFNGLSHYDDFTTSEIPVNPGPYENITRFHMTARQSRLNFDVGYNSSVGLITGKISGDFYSGNTGDYALFRLREAYIQYRNLLLGQTNTTFGNPEVTPNTIDFEGPNSAPTLRNPMISYTNSINSKWSYGVALEMRGTDLTLNDSVDRPLSTTPTLVGNINKSGDWGVVTLSAMTAVNQYFDNGDDTKAKISAGGALSLIINTNKRDHLNLFAVAGSGVANFISDLSGNGYNGILEKNAEQLELLNSYGGFIAYTHFWNDKWSSNLIYSYVGLEKTIMLPDQAFKQSNYALGNLFYQPSDHLIFGVEYIWGDLFTQNNSTGDANRLQFLAQINF